MRYDRDDIITTIYDDKKIEFNFYFDKKLTDDGKKIIKAILSLNGTLKQIADTLIQQLYYELSRTCRTELVKKVFIEISNVYYPSKEDYSGSPRVSKRSDGDINMDFFTEYIIETETGEGIIRDRNLGFVCGTTLGRFNKKQRKFREISNSMLSCCELL